jgi:valyl-tRNA synthetase
MRHFFESVEELRTMTIQGSALPTELPKSYDPSQVEGKWYARWKEMGFFHEEPDPSRPPYCITIPPPNITGSLHIGHALNNTILDVFTRWHRMRGFCTLCLPGTDHAGIATQTVVERELEKEGLTRQQLGREKFIERCWQWREQYGNRIYYQFEKLGCSYDWQRVRFTMDPSYVEAIMTVFGSWYERGLIYRGTRVVNWDVKLQTAVSDIEVNVEERPGKLYHFRYPFADGNGFITIATTRPETMLGDTAVAAHPDDPRYKPHFGRLLRLPLTDRLIPLIPDDYAKPEFGSGAVKVTPAHDLNDFECGLRHNLPQIVVIDKEGRMTEAAGPEFAGLDRYEARAKVVEAMKALGLLEKIEDYTIQTPISDRSGEVIEPLLSEQWFVRMKPLAQPAIEVVKQGKIRFIPERYTEIYLRWMENIRDWCISRQLWWGHRIPVWWTEEGGERQHTFARSREEAVAKLGTENVWQDEDVLDTWFSSALWPHATLGWPRETPELAYFYPTNLLSTAQEILYLWVARMIITGLDFIKRPADRTPEADGLLEEDGKQRAIIPFRDVYIHATVLDEKGERMSKSKGNGVDPVELIDRFGADATRFSLMQQAGKNQDIRYSAARTEIAATFCNKLWNASRFVLSAIGTDGHHGEVFPHSLQKIEDRWILSRLHETIAKVNTALANYDMDDATHALYHFFWDDFCDWYIEIAKLRLKQPQEGDVVRTLLAQVLETTLRLLHPIIPFITEEIWQRLPHSGDTICLAPYPQAQPAFLDAEACAGMERIKEVVRALRNLRAQFSVPASVRVEGAIVPSEEKLRVLLEPALPIIQALARLSRLSLGEAHSGQQQREGKWVAEALAGLEVLLCLGDEVDSTKELERIEKELEAVAKQIARSEGLLNNPQFVERAKPEIVEKERATLAEWQAKREALERRKQQLLPS